METEQTYKKKGRNRRQEERDGGEKVERAIDRSIDRTEVDKYITRKAETGDKQKETKKAD